jgi:hypothetical protein
MEEHASRGQNMGAIQDSFQNCRQGISFLETTGSVGYHGAAHMATNVEASLLATTQVKLRAAEDDLAAALVRHSITGIKRLRRDAKCSSRINLQRKQLILDTWYYTEPAAQHHYVPRQEVGASR